MKINIDNFLKGHIFVAFFILTVLPVLLINSYPFDSIKAWLAGLVAFGAVCFYSIYWIKSPKRYRPSLSIIDILLLLYYIAYMASGACAVHKEATFLVVINEYAFVFIYIFFRIVFSKHFNEGSFVYYIIAATVLALSGWALAQYFFQLGVGKILKELFKTNHYPVIASFGNPNFLAEFLVLALPFSLYLLRKRTMIFFPIFIIQGMAIFVTYSRLAWAVSALFMLVTIICIARSERKKLAIIYCILIIILGIFFLRHYSAGTTKSQRIIKSISKTIFFDERKLIYLSSMRMLQDSSVLGKGPGYFSFHYLEYQGKTARKIFHDLRSHDYIDLDHAHSDIIEAGIDSGYAGMACYVVLLLYAAIAGVRLFRINNDNSMGLVLLLAIPFSIWAFPNYILFSKIVILLALAFIANQRKKYDFALQRLIVVLLIIMGIISIYFQTRFIISAVYYGKGLDNFKNPRGIDYFMQGIDYCPENGLNHFAAGSFLLNEKKIEGIAKIEKSLTLMDNSRAYIYLARAYRDFGQFAQAKEWFKKYLFIRPDDELARLEYEELLRDYVD